MQGPWGRNTGAKVSEASLSVWCACPQLQKPNHSTFTLSKKKTRGPMGGESSGRTRTCSRNSAPTASRPDAVVLCVPLPSMNLRIFPNISPAPYPLSGWNPSPVSLPFCLPGSIIPDHSLLHVLLLNPKNFRPSSGAPPRPPALLESAGMSGSLFFWMMAGEVSWGEFHFSSMFHEELHCDTCRETKQKWCPRIYDLLIY